jgi:hypothetical protein
MVSIVGKFKAAVACAHCSKNVSRPWVVRYSGYRFVRYIYLCPSCNSVIKITDRKPRLIVQAQLAPIG